MGDRCQLDIYLTRENYEKHQELFKWADDEIAQPPTFGLPLIAPSLTRVSFDEVNYGGTELLDELDCDFLAINGAGACYGRGARVSIGDYDVAVDLDIEEDRLLFAVDRNGETSKDDKELAKEFYEAYEAFVEAVQ